MKRSSYGIIALVLCLFSLLHSCVFAPTEMYKSEDKKSTETPIVNCTVELSMSQDTIFVYDAGNYSYSSNSVVFNFKCNTGAVLQVKRIVDGDEKSAVIYTSDKYMNDINNNINYSYTRTSFQSNSNSITINIDRLSLGAHTLELQFITNSGSGSIADNLGVEGYASKKWVIISLPAEYAIKDTVKNGILRLDWQMYKANDLKGYVVQIDYESTEKRVNTPYFIDSGYVGQGRRYSIYALKTNGSREIIGYKDIEQKKIGVNVMSIKDYGLALKLVNNKYYGAIDSLYIVLSDYTDSIVIKKKYASDSIFKVEGTINKTYSGTISIVPKDKSCYRNSSYMYNYQSYVNVRIGQEYIPSSYFNDMKCFDAISKDEFIYSLNGELYRYSVLEQKKYTSAVKVCNKSDWWLSSSKKTLFYLDECDLKLRTLSTANGITSLKDYSTSSSSPTAGMLAISDVDTKLTYNSQDNSLYVTNMNTGQDIAHSEPVSSYNITGKITTDGNYVLYSADSKLTLCSVSNGSLAKIWGTSYFANIYYEINSINDNEFVYKTESTFTIKSTKTGEDIASYWLGDEVFSIDFKNNEMLCYNSPYFRIRNLRNGSLIKEIKTEYCSRGDVILSNHTLIYKSGIYHFVQY